MIARTKRVKGLIAPLRSCREGEPGKHFSGRSQRVRARPLIPYDLSVAAAALAAFHCAGRVRSSSRQVFMSMHVAQEKCRVWEYWEYREHWEYWHKKLQRTQKKPGLTGL